MISSPSSPSPRNTLRSRRTHRGWSQARLAEMAGITRQSYAAIESGRSMPSTEVALRLARALASTVEELFSLPGDPTPPEKAWDPALPTAGLLRRGPRRVRLARISGRLTAFPLGLGGVHASLAADGVAREVESPGDDVPTLEVQLLAHRRPPPDLVVAGCDPALGLVVEGLRRQWDMEVLWIPAGSRAALEALARGRVHVAGTHLLEPGTGEYNAPWIRRMVPFPTIRVGFATWEQALVVRARNPLGLRGVEDLARAGVRLVNREPGSGSRALLEHCLREAGLPPDGLPGFDDTVVLDHDQVGATVAAGLADAGVAIRAVAAAWGLEALPLAREPFELVFPEHLLDLPAAQALLELLQDPWLHRQVELLGGYDTSGMGRPA